MSTTDKEILLEVHGGVQRIEAKQNALEERLFDEPSGIIPMLIAADKKRESEHNELALRIENDARKQSFQRGYMAALGATAALILRGFWVKILGH